MKKLSPCLKSKWFKLLFLSGMACLCAISLKAEPESEDLNATSSLSESQESSALNDDDSLKDLENVIKEERGKRTIKPKETSDSPQPEPSPEVADKENDEIPTPVKNEPDSKPQDSIVDTTPAEKNTITNLEFKMVGKNSRIVITAKNKLFYKEENNPSLKQVVYYFKNTETPQKLQRAYDTTEFDSPVSLFTLFQFPSKPQTKLIVQLREDKLPQLIPTTTGLVLEFPEAGAATKEGEPRVEIAGEDKKNETETTGLFKGKRIQKLEIKNGDVQDVLKLLAKSSGYNIVVSDDVTGKVGTLSLNDVSWDEAFTLVLQSKKLGYIRQGNILRVTTLNTLRAEREEVLASNQAAVRLEELKTVLIPISYARSADLSQRLRSFLSERGTVDTDARTNTIIIKDIEKNVQKVQRLIASLDVPPARVSISARVIEMLNSYTRSIGFSNISFNESFAGIDYSETLTFGGSGGTSVTTLAAADFANLLGTFQIGETENKVKLLANPSVTVVANQQATISQSISFFIPVSTAVNGTVTTSVQQITASLNLDVTPIVSSDGSIFMTVAVRNEIPRGSGQNRQIDNRSVNTQVLVENGDTAVIGGVFYNTVNNTKESVPFLSKIPIVGFLLSRTGYEDTKNEIFIFITAKILNPDEALRRTL